MENYLYYLKTVLSKIMGSVTGQGYRFERARVIEDVGSDKSFFVITVKDSFKELEEQATDSPRSAARAFHILLVLLKNDLWKVVKQCVIKNKVCDIQIAGVI